MADAFEHIKSLEGGANFLRADLHIHSYGEDGSYDVSDSTMTVEGIIDRAVAHKISVISITDHNSAKNVKAAINYAEGKNVLVLPGVELTTNEGHLLVYTETLKQLEAVIGAQKYSADGKNCLSTMAQCLDSVVEQNGFAIAAHVDKDRGFEAAINGYGEPKLAVLQHTGLLAIEASDKAALKWFTSDDDHEERTKLSKLEVIKRGFSVNDRARVVFSDSHKLENVGKNASGQERVTRIKLAEKSFSAVKTAFMDPTARVRAEEVIPAAVPRFVGAKFEGGFLDGQSIKFNKNLNCIIGGRGSGKSTLIESVKVTSGNQRDNANEDRLLDSEVWPEKLTLFYRDEVGTVHELVRTKGDYTINQTDPADGITVVPIESYGQGETSQFIQDSNDAPAVLTEFLDRFIDFENLMNDDENHRTNLLENHQKISTLEAELKQLPEYRRLHKDAETKLAALKKQNVKALVEYEESLAEERALRSELGDEIQNHKEAIAESFDRAVTLDIEELTKGKKILAGKVELDKIKDLIKQYVKLASDTSTAFQGKAEAVLVDIDANIRAWKVKEAVLVQRIEDKKDELIKQGIKPDSAFIASTAKSVADYSVKIHRLEGQQAELGKLLARRKELITERATTKRAIYAKRLSFARSINKQLSDTIEYEVNVAYKEAIFSPSFCEYLQSTMQWRTSQVPKAKIVADNISPADFLSMITRRDRTKLVALQDSNGSAVFSKSDIDGLFATFADNEKQRGLEELLFEDRPEITVTKHIADVDGNKRVAVREFHKLSLGQQQAIFLTILLHSGRNTPLIIDQPEDNLDSEFIFKTVVTTLRKIKEQRQVIVVTHNANITVLGDAELIIPLRSSNDQAAIVSCGSIDTAATKVMACTILEGGDKAFMHRKDLYGL
jgi:ABC-type lipoprotein export system ATPase subunit/histidinol phosphatase-like PHP family hydrolase